MSKKGKSTVVVQRATGVILVPLAVWTLINLVSVLSADPSVALAWLTPASKSIVFGAFLAIGAWHMRIGMSEIIVDYLHGWPGDVLRVLNWALALGLYGASAAWPSTGPWLLVELSLLLAAVPLGLALLGELSPRDREELRAAALRLAPRRATG